MMNGQPLWEHFDFMSVEAKLYIKGKDRYTTKLGSLMTILSFICVIVISAFFIKYWFEKVDMNVLYMKENSDEEFVMDLNFKPFYFKLADANGITIDPRYATITLYDINVNDKIILLNKTDLERCTYQKHVPDPKYTNYLANTDFESYFCINNTDKNLNITMNKKMNIYRYFNLYIHECNNSTLNNNSCYPREKIKDYLSKASFYIRYYMPDVIVDHYNSEEPLQEKVLSYNVKVQPEVFYRSMVFFKQVKYTSDEGSVMKDDVTWISYGKDEASYSETIPPKSALVPNSYGALSFTMDSGKIDKYKRQYQKLQTVLANIGGILKSITTFSAFLVKFVSSQMLDVFMSNNFVNDDEKLQKTNSNVSRKSTVSTERLKSPVPILKTRSPVIKTATARRSLTFFEALMPKQWTKATSAKKNLESYSKIIKYYLSTNNFLKLFKDFENFKYLYFNQKESEIFENMRCASLREHLEKIGKIERRQRLNEKSLNCIEMSKNIKDVLKSNDDKENLSSDNRILQKMMERM